MAMSGQSSLNWTVSEMERKQYFTSCRYCGRQILMTRNTDTGRFTPCDPQIGRYIPNPNGNVLYVNEDGKSQWGYKDYPEGCYEFGYLKHYTSCSARGRN